MMYIQGELILTSCNFDENSAKVLILHQVLDIYHQVLREKTLN